MPKIEDCPQVCLSESKSNLKPLDVLYNRIRSQNRNISELSEKVEVIIDRLQGGPENACKSGESEPISLTEFGLLNAIYSASEDTSDLLRQLYDRIDILNDIL